MTILLTIVCFFCGSLMFSYWLGVILGENIRAVGDGNPGGVNLWKAVGVKYGVVGISLDFLKGYLPVLFLIKSQIITDSEIVPISIAPILGHAFSPFLKFKGGKAIAVSFGVWSAVTDFKVSIVYAIILAILQAGIRLIKKGRSLSAQDDSFLIMFGMFLVSIYLKWMDFPTPIFAVWLGNLLILISKGLTSSKHLHKTST